MTIAQAFNEIAVAQGGTAAKSGAITAAIDALNDALAGSDQPQAKTIEEAVRLLGEHIGGGGGSVKHQITLGQHDHATVTFFSGDDPVTDDPVTESAAGELLFFMAEADDEWVVSEVSAEFGDGLLVPLETEDGSAGTFIMPNGELTFTVTTSPDK